jgi:subtilase family serine protease
MRKAWISVVAVGAAALTAAVMTAAAAPVAASSRAVSPWLTIKPGVIRLAVAARQGPFGTAQCEKAYGFPCYQPWQISSIYGLPFLYKDHVTGKGATIVIVDSFGSPTIRHDLTVFDKQFHYPAPPSFRIMALAGKIPRYNPANSAMVTWAGETTLDVEYAHALAPGANIVLAETPVSETEGVHGFPQIVQSEEWLINHHIGDVISQSFSATEQTFPGYAKLAPLRAAYIDADRHNVTVLAASGDSGAADVGSNGLTYYTHPVTSWPDSDPLVTGVGGTRLEQVGRGYVSVAWNDTAIRAVNEYFAGDAGPNPFAGGGGKSIFFTRPSYQDGVKSVVGNRRGVPDISMNASCSAPVDVYSTYGGQPPGWSLVCGTSEATPEFAAIVALAVQEAGHPLGLINPMLYALSAAHARGIVDVTSGNNSVLFYQGKPLRRYKVTGFPARKGYDLATGVGTISAPQFVPELAGK